FRGIIFLKGVTFMAEKKSVFKKLFSKPNQDCCNVEIEEKKSTENESCCGSTTENNEEQQKEAYIKKGFKHEALFNTIQLKVKENGYYLEEIAIGHRVTYFHSAFKNS